MTSTASRQRGTKTIKRASGAALASVTAVGLSANGAAADTVWDRVAECESGGNWSINTGNGYYGGLQFYHPTWTGFGGQSYAPYAHQATKAEQIKIAQKVLQQQGPGAWPVCSVRAGLTMENGMAPVGGGGEPAPEPPSDGGGASAQTYVVTATVGANIRSGPGLNYSVVGGAGYNVKVTGTLSNGWVKLSNGNGYISKTILGASGGSAATPPSSGSSSMAELALDGSRGPLTTKAIQKWVGVPQTGSWDTTTIKAVQAEVGTRVDGYWGPMSQASLQDHIGISRDGSTYMNYRTVVGLQKWLNANVIG